MKNVLSKARGVQQCIRALCVQTWLFTRCTMYSITVYMEHTTACFWVEDVEGKRAGEGDEGAP